MMKKKQKVFYREAFRILFLLNDSLELSFGVKAIPHCLECKKPIQWSGAVYVDAKSQFTWHPTESAQQGECECSIYRIIPEAEDGK